MSKNDLQWSRLFRPERPEDLVVGNPEILGEAKQAAKKTVAMLVVGEYGSGKTSLARAMANEINGDQKSTIEEPSTERGKAYIEKLQERVKYMPPGKKWIVIIDEVHNLTKDAFTALLKLTEDPPHKRIMFVLCTNKAHKLPKEIVSRCKRIEIEKPELKPAATALLKILKEANPKLYAKLAKEDRSKLVRKAIKDANFGMRQAVENLESMHDKLVSGTTVSKILGIKQSEDGSDDAAIGGVEEDAGQLLNAIFSSTAKNVRDVTQFIMVKMTKADPILTIERMAGILYYGYSLQYGGKWDWQSKPFKAIFPKGSPEISRIMPVLEGLAYLREHLKTAEGDQAILASVELCKIVSRLVKLEKFEK